MSIEQNQKTIYIPTPYDDQIEALNDRLNDTYVYYGKTGESKKENQLYQDKKKPEGLNINVGPGGLTIEKK